MIVDFEIIMENIVATLPSVSINSSDYPVRYYWGRGIDLHQYLSAMRNESTPLVWSVPKRDEETETDGMYTRDAVINICHVETRRQLLNTDRLSANNSFQAVLYPVWESLKRAIEISDQISIRANTLTFEKFPNFSTNQEKGDAIAVWDVLQVEFTAEINEAYNC